MIKNKMQMLYNIFMEIKDLKKNMAANLRQLRAKSKLSQEKLSEMTGISQQFICNIETEKVNPSIETMLKIANALGVKLNDLVY